MNTDNWLERTELLLGKEKLDLLRKAHVLVVGLGGVGAYAAEMIVRAPSSIGLLQVLPLDRRPPAEILLNACDINREIELRWSALSGARDERRRRDTTTVDASAPADNWAKGCFGPFAATDPADGLGAGPTRRWRSQSISKTRTVRWPCQRRPHKMASPSGFRRLLARTDADLSSSASRRRHHIHPALFHRLRVGHQSHSDRRNELKHLSPEPNIVFLDGNCTLGGADSSRLQAGEYKVTPATPEELPDREARRR